ncbi:conserved unknown protein [Ectocarpus siliculosus]|uniref:Uncharacterized protein n=1 Tax=Ectocarpus siliculosus TaxID=2880 RepID=D8LR11_ECTSI|nr:conserved unknown protein [Ectocarpus siliculosus]|eukprot:CBN77684.1 conserved unknown protein [Ectocarpus siliculosus]
MPSCEAPWCRGGYSRSRRNLCVWLAGKTAISAGQQKTGYHPRQTGVGEGPDPALEAFKKAPITGLLSEVPGIGPKFSGLLGEGEGEDCIKNTFQLIGKFLVLRTSNEEDGKLIDCVEHCDKFYWWLQSKGIGFRGRIVQCIAEKVNMSYPGIYDREAWTDPQDEK